MSERDPLLPAPPQPTSRYRKWQRKLAQFLESPRLHKIVLTLVCYSSFITFINSDRKQISIDAACVLADLTYSFLSPTCETPGEEGSPTWLLVLSQISLVITTLFLIEIPISLWAFGPKHLNPWGPVPHAGLHVFDALIILTTFTGEVVLRGKEREIAGLLVFLRLWRLVKLVGGEQLR